VTDANLLLGRLPGTARLGGDVALDIAAAERAMQVLADELRLDRTEVAAGVVAVADAAMANAIREITVARGIDPREFDLVAFGGAAALHAAALADDLGMRRVIVPAVPGVLSARGMLDADTRHDLSQPLFSLVADIDPDGLRHTVAELAAQGRRMLAEEGTPEDRVELAPAVDLRYVGQEYTLTIPWDLDDDVTRLVADLPKRFADAYLDRYGHNNPSEEVECIAVRLVALGRTPAAVTARLAARPAPQPTGREQTRFGGQWHDTPVYWRDDVGPGVTLAGPTILLETSCTTVVPPQWSMTVSDHGHLTLERTPA
jgi:N-methylhydantoinase A